MFLCSFVCVCRWAFIQRCTYVSIYDCIYTTLYVCVHTCIVVVVCIQLMSLGKKRRRKKIVINRELKPTKTQSRPIQSNFIYNAAKEASSLEGYDVRSLSSGIQSRMANYSSGGNRLWRWSWGDAGTEIEYESLKSLFSALSWGFFSGIACLTTSCGRPDDWLPASQ